MVVVVVVVVAAGVGVGVAGIVGGVGGAGGVGGVGGVRGVGGAVAVAVAVAGGGVGGGVGVAHGCPSPSETRGVMDPNGTGPSTLTEMILSSGFCLDDICCIVIWRIFDLSVCDVVPLCSVAEIRGYRV